MTPVTARPALAAALGAVHLDGRPVPVHPNVPARWSPPAVFIAAADPWLTQADAPWNVFDATYQLRLYVAAGDTDRQVADLEALVTAVVSALLANPAGHAWSVDAVTAPEPRELPGMGTLLGADVTVSAPFTFTPERTDP